MKKNTRNKIKKIMIFIIVIFIAIVTSYQNSFAATGINPSTYRPHSRVDEAGEVKGANKLLAIGNDIIGLLQIVGTILLVVVLVILGIKYMMGSAEEKAEYKKTMGPYLLGAVMVFAITSILKIIAYFAQNVGYI